MLNAQLLFALPAIDTWRLWIRVLLREGHMFVAEARVEVGEETLLNTLNPEGWNLKAWPYFIESMMRQLEDQQGSEEDEVKSILRELRAEIDDLRLMGLINIKCPW